MPTHDSEFRTIVQGAIDLRRQIEAALWEQYGYDPRTLEHRTLSDDELDELVPLDPEKERRHRERRRPGSTQ